jgi:hypothetical protein
MITLKTLPQATAQEVFDQVANHLLIQRAVCIGHDGNCMYHLDGMRCAAGCLISEDEYKTQFENSIWYKLVTSGLVSDNHEKLIAELQSIHDNIGVSQWKEYLKDIADRYSLTFNV